MGRLTTHVLDTANGRPAAGVAIVLLRIGHDGEATLVTETLTNADGRTEAPLMAAGQFETGSYELIFNVGEYFARSASAGSAAFLDLVPVRFTITEPDGHYHVPLLVSPWSYSTYRGS